jgi:GNAT superfamily N-acetyltransferase
VHASIHIRGADRPGDLGWMVQQHGEQYAREFGWDTSFEALVARIVADFAATDDRHARGWIAERDGERIGCILCVPDDEADTARLRILLVTPEGRGLGVGAALVDTVVAFAASVGCRRVVLWTNDVLAAARRIYESAGFELVGEEAHHSYGHDLVGQTWRLDCANLPA